MPDSSSDPQIVEGQSRAGLFTAIAPATVLTATVLLFGLSDGGPDMPIHVHWGDKLQHAIAFCIVGYSYMRAAKRLFPRAGLWRRRRMACYLAFALGALLEVIQAFVPHRTAEFFDLVADAAGVALALLGVHLVDGEPLKRES